MAPYTSSLALLLAFSATFSKVAGLTQTYCSNQNTGSGNGASYWQYQSNGWCHDHCNGNTAFAVVQGFNCWCSDYAPSNQQDISECDDICPGFGTERCGNQGDGLFGYIALDKNPSGTAGGSTPSSSQRASAPSRSSSSSLRSSSPLPSTSTYTSTLTLTSAPSPISTSFSTPKASSTRPVAELSTQTPVSSSTPSKAPTSATPSSSSPSSTTPSSTSSPTPSSSSQSSSRPSSSSSSSTSSWTPSPITSIQVITESGAAITKTVTFIPTSPSGQLSQTSKGGVSSGVIAGAVVGSLAGLAAIIGVLVWLLAYRRRRNNHDEDFENGVGGAGIKKSPQRHASTMSRAGLLRSEKQYPAIAIPGPTRHSSNGTEGISPMSGSQPSNPERRHSRPLFYDQRLNPSALMDLDNGSHTSILTIEDNRDYTRTLNVRNPDPPAA